MKFARQNLYEIDGQVSFADRVHQMGDQEDFNGRRFRAGVWTVRHGNSQMDFSLNASRITSIMDFHAKDGRNHIQTVQANGEWTATLEPELVWDDE